MTARAKLPLDSISFAGRSKPHAAVGYESDLRDEGDAWLRLRYQVDGTPVDSKVRLVTSQPTFGGRRWWFICPLVRHDGGPARRVGKLYLPSGAKSFGSREGYGLTYQSCQESGKLRSLHRLVAARMGTDEATIRAVLKRGTRS